MNRWCPPRSLLASIGTTVKHADIGRIDVNGWELDAGTLLGYRFIPGGVGVTPRVGVNVRNVIDGALESNGQAVVALERAALFGAAVEVVPPWQRTTGSVLKALATLQSDAFYGDRAQKPVVRSGLELTALGLVAGRLGVRRDHETQQTLTDFGFGLGYAYLHVAPRPLALQFDFASLDGPERSEVYTLWARLGLL